MAGVGMPVDVIIPFDTNFSLATAAYRAHHSTSSSLIRSASPPLILNG
jgi:hypothetical protein